MILEILSEDTATKAKVRGSVEEANPSQAGERHPAPWTAQSHKYTESYKYTSCRQDQCSSFPKYHTLD